MENSRDDSPRRVPPYCDDVLGQMDARWAQFQGSYRSQETSLLSARSPADSQFWCSTRVSRAGTKDPALITGDGFSIDLTGGPYPMYTRAGYIENGNIQVDNIGTAGLSGGVAWL